MSASGLALQTKNTDLAVIVFSGDAGISTLILLLTISLAFPQILCDRTIHMSELILLNKFEKGRMMCGKLVRDPQRHQAVGAAKVLSIPECPPVIYE